MLYKWGSATHFSQPLSESQTIFLSIPHALIFFLITSIHFFFRFTASPIFLYFYFIFFLTISSLFFLLACQTISTYPFSFFQLCLFSLELYCPYHFSPICYLFTPIDSLIQLFRIILNLFIFNVHTLFLNPPNFYNFSFYSFSISYLLHLTLRCVTTLSPWITLQSLHIFNISLFTNP